MNIPFGASTATLDRQHALRLPSHTPARVRALRGSLWITLDGDPRDIDLPEGQSFEFDGSKAAVIGTLDREACAQTCAEVQPSLWLRLRAMLARGAEPALG